MSQNDLVIANQAFPATRADITSALQALGSNNSGATAPSTTYANMMWYDTTSNILKIRAEANDAWINIGYLDQSLDTFKILDDTIVATTAGATTGLIGDQTTGTWEAGTGTTESLVSPAKVKAAIDAIAPLETTTGSAPYFGARAWVSFNGYNGTINASGNVTSVTRNGTGDYTINFTTAMPDANYTVHAMPTRNRTDRPYWVYHLQPNSTSDITTSSVRVRGGYVSGTNDGSYNQPSDFPQVSVTIFR